MQELAVHRPIQPATAQLLLAHCAGHSDAGSSGGHSDQQSPGREDDHREDTDQEDNRPDSEEDNRPMDLSSGGGPGVTALLGSSRGPFGGLPVSDHPLLNARRLAELVRQQHRESELREREGKRKWEDRDEDKDIEVTGGTDLSGSLIPLQLIRAKWEKVRTSPEPCQSPPGSGAPRTSPDSLQPSSPAGSSSGSESGREVKKRRLDQLLSKKFERAVGTAGGGSVVVQLDKMSGDPVTSSQIRRLSQEGGSSPKVHRRKQAHPSSPVTPPSIAIRPHTELFPPPPATSSPRARSPPAAVKARPASPEVRTVSPVPAVKPPKSPASAEGFGKEELLRNQILQVSTLLVLYSTAVKLSRVDIQNCKV